MKKCVAILVFLVSFTSCIIKNVKPEDCVVETIIVTKIAKGSSHDIVFYDNGTDFFYINRGLERGLNLDSLNAKVLNKAVTLHLPKFWIGTSEHIAQLAIGEEIIFTEFK